MNAVRVARYPQTSLMAVAWSSPRPLCGLIINFGSLAATLPIPFHGYLSSSKAAIITFSDALRLEVKNLGIAVTVVEPGMVATHQGEQFAQLKVAGSISDYTGQETRAIGVIEHGQRAGSNPDMVAQTVMKIIRSKGPGPLLPRRCEKWYLRLSRILPPSATESLMTRHFRLAR